MSKDLDHEQLAFTVNEAADHIGQWANSKGFHDDWKSADLLDRLADDAAMKVDQKDLRDAAGIIRNNVIGTKLMLIVSEASEALETLRDVGCEGIMSGQGNFAEELADIEIRVKDLANMLGLDLGAAQAEKIEKNMGRPHKHGRNF